MGVGKVDRISQKLPQCREGWGRHKQIIGKLLCSDRVPGKEEDWSNYRAKGRERRPP